MGDRAPGADPAVEAARLPAHLRIAELLIREIAAGHLADGARLPPERRMAAGLGVAVGTLRKALAGLARKGLIERIQGSGNYVRARRDVASVYAFFRLERPSGGGLPAARLLSVARLPKPPDAPDFGPSPLAHRIRRVRSIDGTDVAAEEIWLDAGRVPDLPAGVLGESLYFGYATRLGLVIGRVEDRLGIAAWPDWMRLSDGPACLVRRLAAEAGHGPVEFSLTWFDPARAAYINRMGQ